MGFFSSKGGGSDQGKTSAEGGNGNVRDTSHSAAGRHSAIETANLAAVRDLATSGDRNYVGRHRSN